MNALLAALAKLASDADAAIQNARELISSNDLQTIRDAVEMVHCLQRLIAKGAPSIAQIHAAFGAPGDFGYESDIGKALEKIYRGEA